MKSLAPFAGLALLLVPQAGNAQTPCYDPITSAPSFSYGADAAYGLIGDILSSPCGNISQIRIGFVALAPGTYPVFLKLFGDTCLGCPGAGSAFAVTIPAGGPFPSAWIVTRNANVPVAGPIQSFSVRSPGANLKIAFTAQSPIANGVDGMSVDLNPTDGCLNPGFTGCPSGAEWLSTGDQTNLLVALYTPPNLAALRGPFADDATIEVERIEVPIRRSR